MAIKQIILTAWFLLAVVFLLPILLFGLAGEGEDLAPAAGSSPPVLGATAAPVPLGTADRARTITLYRTQSAQTETLTASEYLWGVVAAEMPASFQREALKAQCVAARTYALRKGRGVTAEHPEAMMCDDITCCQAYITPEQAAGQWGESAAFYRERVAAAVAETDGLVLTYGGELIDAVFHSSSQGSTADAAQVWGASVPYLVPVETPEGEEVPNYHTTVTVPLEDFTAAIRTLYPEASFGADYTAWFGMPTYTTAGAVSRLPAGGAEVTGIQYRTLFGLRSARFTLSVGESGVTFHVTGYGHGVGMSQYGANAMAGEGKTFREILTHYYTGCQVTAAED